MRIKCACVGVDLGTTNSTIAYLRNNRIHVPELIKGKQTIPSTVTITKQGLKVLTELENIDNNKKLIYETKRLIGKQYDEIKGDFIKFNYPIIKNELNGHIQIHCTDYNKFITPEEVSSTILKYLYEAVQRQTNELIDKAVIAIPNHFSRSQKLATIKASKMAGVNDVALIQEPVAAALSYGIGLGLEPETILVLDIGGGTFDISIIEFFEKIIEVVATIGDQNIGGRNFDYLIFDWMIEASGINKRELNKLEIEKMYKKAEKAKIEVIENGKAIIDINTKRLVLSIDIFNELCKSMIKKFLKPIEKIGIEASITWDNNAINNKISNDDKYAPPPRKITKIILTGLSCKIPILLEHLKLFTGINEIKYEIDPKLCVAIGACIYSELMEGNINDIEIMDGTYVSTLHNRISGFQSNL